ncbi:DUF2783 domain-containing protein [Klebsiella variicola subsp. variicola]|nr:DUF2783 domain-containing protein [Klebsiella variicola subsp. variicola]
MSLKLIPSKIAGDALFSLLVEAHDGLEESECNQLDASLILILANHIGSEEVIVEAIDIARKSMMKTE